MISDSLTILFEDQEHRRLHYVLLAFGFSFEVRPPDCRIGLLYRHPRKQLEVELSVSDGECRAATYDLTKKRGERIVTDESYTGFEWDWLEDAPNEAEFLRRELHILVHVRPKSMTQTTTKKDY